MSKVVFTIYATVCGSILAHEHVSFSLILRLCLAHPTSFTFPLARPVSPSHDFPFYFSRSLILIHANSHSRLRLNDFFPCACMPWCYVLTAKEKEKKEKTGMKCLVPGAPNIKSTAKFFGWPICSALSFLNNEFEVVLITSPNSFFVRPIRQNKENRKTWPTVSFQVGKTIF